MFSLLVRSALTGVVVLSTAACVTITPIARVADDVSPPPASAPTVDPTRPPAGNPTKPPAQPTNPPGKRPSPAATPDPTAAPATQPPTGTGSVDPVDPNDPACSDDAYNLAGYSWNETWQWHYNAASTPQKYNRQDVLALIVKSIDNMTTERNDCGRPDTISIDTKYMGDTELQACPDEGDGQNVIAWGKIPGDLSPDTIAYTCPYYYRGSHEIAEADIVISTDVDWALTKDNCFFEEMLEPTVTHEMGHVLGLAHVSERQHPDLTMSTESNGPCNDDEATLGLGDMLGLESLYPIK